MERNDKFVKQDAMYTNVNVVAAEIRGKIDKGEKLTQADLNAIKTVAKTSSRPEHIALYSQAKATLSAQEANMTDEEKEAAKPTHEQRLEALEQAVADARDKAMRKYSVEARVAYVNAKNDLALEREINKVANQNNDGNEGA